MNMFKKAENILRQAVLFSCCLFIMSGFICRAEDAVLIEEEIIEKYPAAEEIPEKAKRKKKLRPLTDFVYFSGYADVSAGYSSNVDYDSDRHKNAFYQMFFNSQINCIWWDNIRPLLGFNAFITEYSNHPSADNYNITPYLGLDWKLAPKIIWKNRVMYDYLNYPDNTSGNYRAAKLSTAIKHLITSSLSQELIYEWANPNYMKRHIRLGNGTKANDVKQLDYRYRFVHYLRFRMKKLALKLMNEFIIRESNYEYLDYYDHWSYRVKPSASYYITDKLSASLGCGVKAKFYEREASDNSADDVEDIIITPAVSLYYDISKRAALGVTYSYSQDFSNDPEREYSGSAIYTSFTYLF